MTIPNRLSEHSTPLNEMFQQDDEVHSLGRLFAGCVTYLDRADGESGICRFCNPFYMSFLCSSDLRFIGTYLSFGKARIVDSLDNLAITHVIVSRRELFRLPFIRLNLSQYLHVSRQTDSLGVPRDYLA